MNIELLKDSGVDYEEGLDRFSGNTALYEKYLKKLLTLDVYSQMKSAALNRDIQGAFQAAHKLKAFIGNLSLTSFYEEIKALTEEFRAGVDRDYSKDFITLDQEYANILQAIRGNEDE